jgi:hypothetical protein
MDIGLVTFDGKLGRFSFGHSYSSFGVKNLAVKVAQIN